MKTVLKKNVYAAKFRQQLRQDFLRVAQMHLPGLAQENAALIPVQRQQDTVLATWRRVRSVDFLSRTLHVASCFAEATSWQSDLYESRNLLTPASMARIVASIFRSGDHVLM